MRPTDSPPVVDRGQIVAGLRDLGLIGGDKVLVHTSLSSFGRVDGGAVALIGALLDVVGSDGLLMMPYFPPPLYEGVFDPSRPPEPYTGRVPQTLRTWPGTVLSIHPSHPVVALGRSSELVTQAHYLASAVGRDSPVDRLAKMGGKVLLLGVDQCANTTIHTGEAYAGVAYWGKPRPDRPPGRWILLPTGQTVYVSLPETPGDDAGFPGIEPWLIEHNLINFGTIGRATCRLMPGQLLIEAVVEFLLRDPAGLLCTRPDCAFCRRARLFLADQA